MAEWQIVLLKITTMFLVILVGWALRRKRRLTAEVTGALGRLVVDVTLPALVFTEILRTVDRPGLRDGWCLPLIGAGIIGVSHLVGTAAGRLFARAERRNTFVLLVAIPNWLYMTLPIVRALYGNEGMRALLLYNVGMHAALWSLGVWTIRGSRPDRESFRKLWRSPGLAATALGVVTVVLLPAANGIATIELADARPAEAIASVFFLAAGMLGSLTVPLSFLIIGSQLGGLGLAEHLPTREVWAAAAGRLVLAPVAVVGLVALAGAAGLEMDRPARMVGYLIACMPVATTCGVFAERFGGDTSMAARTVFYSTLLSVATAPAFFCLIGILGL